MSAEVNQPFDPLNTQTQPEEVTVEPSVETFTLDPDPSFNPSEAAAAELQSELQTTIQELTQRLDALKTQLDDRNNQYARLAADFDNFRKRTQKEKEDLEQTLKCATIKELLPVVDNFERARSQIKPQTDAEMTIHKSYQGVYKDLVDRLKKVGVAVMRVENEPFDPNLHEAVMRETTADVPEGTIVEELRRGYTIGDQVLRHAMVKVAAAPEGLGEESTAG
ncbi:nucleotide exchange factor GrpE [Leptolyngbya sp. FACHB-711]|uniref:nucleotide exchange factor GrpE n=1 Tax=unclassified Leptolyngbya TaxID=2650499 RepID=UPI001684D493|nr:nucleotide exchange factor GrpE [Leptolyngbya sp. FACHB-711]MBD1849346.1 nucleotide exchange factor GrpE [Cyanobacteria bacterium FACHB-502]MBD2024693.1 nucleotide exchange factor GrpE [Leptolyngbya sp. FACHB-711]